MNDEAHGGVMVALGALALRLALTDAHLAYVRSGMKPLLVAAGLVLIVLGGAVLFGRRPGRHGHEEEAAGLVDGHPVAAGEDGAGQPTACALASPVRAHVPPVAWLLILPVLVIALVAPDPLGAFAASRIPEQALAPPTAPFDPLPPPREGAVDLTLSEFAFRAAYDEKRSLEATPVRLVGFVAPDEGGGFLLVRFVLSCCAADGRPVRVAIRGVDPPAPPTNSWVEVVGTWRPRPRNPENPSPPELVALTVRPVPAPGQPYEE